MPSSRPWCGYRRLSVNRDGRKIGLEVQTDAGERCGRTHSPQFTIGHWYEDNNLTAADEDVWREDFEQLLVDLEAGIYDGVVVYRCDRLTRLSGQFERCLRAATKGGAVIVSADEGLRSDRPDDVTMMKIKVVLGEAEVKGMKVRIRDNAKKRSETGSYNGGGKRPYGFEGPQRKDDGPVLNSGRIGIAHIDSEVANLRDAAKRVANGESYTDVIYRWHSLPTPIYGATGAPWNPRTLENILTSHRMLGEQLHCFVDEETGEKEWKPVKAKWEPVLDRATWDKLVSKKKRHEPRGNKLRYLLSPWLLCGRCGHPLTGSQRKYEKKGEQVAVRTYRCRSMPADKARGACGKLSAIAEPVERLTLARIFHRLSETQGFTVTVAEENELQERLRQAGEEFELAEADLEELTMAKADKANRISLSEYLLLKKPILERLDDATSLIKSLTQRMAVPMPTGRDFESLPTWFESLTFGQQQRLVGAHVSSVSVLPPGRSGRYFRPDRVVVSLADAHKAD